MDAPVYYGDTSKILNAGVGTYKDDSRVGIPGEGKTILLAGHNNTFFNDLQHAEAGATVTITTHYASTPMRSPAPRSSTIRTRPPTTSPAPTRI